MKPSLLQKYSIHSGTLILVNEEYWYCESDSPIFLVPVGGENSQVYMERRTAALLNDLMNEIHGWSAIVPVSGWRSKAEQQSIWEQSMQENGAVFTKNYVAFPGQSEHQTGLAIDLGLSRETIDFICPDFPYEGICQSFRKKAAQYGFIERYPVGKEGVTGIAQEPWHFRYVGTPHAEIIGETGLTLEEYHAFLKQFPYGERPLVYLARGRRMEISFLPAERFSNALFETIQRAPFTLSGNNMDGFILTIWKGEI